MENSEKTINQSAPIYRPGSDQEKMVRIVGWVVGIMATATALATVYLLSFFSHTIYARGFITGAAAFWVVFPPIWFFFEYFWLYRTAAAPNSFELFKHGQQTAVAIWAGLSLSLGALAASDYVKPIETNLTCRPLNLQGGGPQEYVCVQTSSQK